MSGEGLVGTPPMPDDSWWQANGYLYGRHLVGDSWICVTRTITGNGRLLLCTPGSIYGAWCYKSTNHALAAAAVWDGLSDPPIGWHRDVYNGRRREDGDPGRETIAP